MSDNIKKMIELYTNDRKGYIEMCKRNIEEKVDWHNNSEYNHGTSANRRYLDTIFESEKGWDARFKQKMNRLVGEFGEFKDNLEEMVHKTKSRPAKIILLSVIAMLAIGSEIYLYLLHQKNYYTLQSYCEMNMRFFYHNISCKIYLFRFFALWLEYSFLYL